MIVGHCIHGLGLGGAQQVIAAIARGRSQDVEHVVYSCEEGVLAEPVRRAGARVRIVPRRIPKFDPFWVSALARSMRDDRIDLVHTHLFGDTLHGLLAAQRIGLPAIATLHTVPEGLSGLQRIGYRWLLPKAYRTVACSRSVEEAFRTDEPGLAGLIVAIPNGVELELATYTEAQRAAARESLGLPSEAIVLACIGRLHPQKAFDRVIDAFARLEASPAARLEGKHPALLWIIGEGPSRRDLEAQAKRLGVSSQVVFAGARADVGELLPLMDGVVFASPYEGLPMALLEAMSAGLAVVALEIEALRDVLESGRDALLVPDTELAGGLERVVRDREFRESIGRGAKRKHREEFSAAKMVAAYESLYREAIALAPPGPVSKEWQSVG